MSMLAYNDKIRPIFLYLFFFKQKTAYELRISDWSSDVCSSDLQAAFGSLPEACARRRANKSLAPDSGLSLPPTCNTARRFYNSVRTLAEENGRASCRERVCQYV